MKDVIAPIATEILIKELTPERFVRITNKGNHEIYIISHHDSPNVMLEVGRLREITFRASGGGTGKSVDIDEFDTAPEPYKQLIVWDPEHKEIIGGYRYIKCKDAAIGENGQKQLSTTEIFHFSDKFMNDYLPTTIELGRSFVQPKYQPSAENRQGLFSLDNLWDGLGALIVDNPDMEYFFGKVTMYPSFERHSRNMILSFMHYYFPDPENLVIPMQPLTIDTDVSEFLASIKGLDYKDGHRILNQQVRERGENIPPLVNTYMNTSPTMKTFGTSVNSHFGDVEETGIMIPIKDIYPTKGERHVSSYKPKK
jgi:Acetyltransferase (GNAT) domain